MKKESQKLNKPLKLLFKTSLIVMVGVMFSKIFSYAYRVIIARYFGAEIYGLFSLSLVIIGWLVTFSSLGLAEGILRYISLYRGKKNIKKIRFIYNIGFKILIFSAIITTIISFFISDFISITIFHNPNLAIFLKIFSFMIPFWIFSRYYLSVMISFERIKQHAIIENIVQNIIKVFLLVLLISFGLYSNAIIFSYFLGIFFIFLLSYLYCKYKLPEIFKKYDLKQKTKKKVFNSLISYCWPVMFFGVVSVLLYWIDSFSIGYFKTATEVGLYNAAIPIALLLSLTPELFLRLLFPLITKEYSRKNLRLIKEITKQVSKWIFIINLPLLLLFIIFPGAIINILFGAEYLLAENALRFLSLGAFVSSLFIISSNLISMVGKSKTILIDLIIVSIINVILNISLIPKPSILGIDNSLGINGAAIATVISITILNILFVFQAKKYTSIIPVRRKMLRIVLISIIPLSLLLCLKSLIAINIFSIIILSIVFFSVYFILLFLLKGFDRNDLMILKSIKQKIIQIRK